MLLYDTNVGTIALLTDTRRRGGIPVITGGNPLDSNEIRIVFTIASASFYLFIF